MRHEQGQTSGSNRSALGTSLGDVDVRLLIVSDHYPPFIGGAHRQTHLLARHMVSRGHEVTVVTSWHRGLPMREKIEGVDVRRVRELRTVSPRLVRNAKQRQHPPYADPVTVRSLRRILRETRPQLVHVHGLLAFSVGAALVGEQIPLLLSARSYGTFCATRTMIHEGLPCTGPSPRKCLRCAGERDGAVKAALTVTGLAASRPLLVRKITGLHSVSTYVHDMMVEHLLGGPDSPAARNIVDQTIPSFLASEAVPSAVGVERYVEQLPHEPFILFVGAMSRLKGLGILLEAYRRLVAAPPLVLIGTRRPDALEFPPGAVVLTDVPNAAVLAAWDHAMFGVMPSLWPEPLGMVVAEGMSRGRPVIGTQTGGHVDMLDAESGILVPQGDVDALARAMQDLIDDPERREAMGRAARERARMFTAESVVPRFEQLYDNIARENAAAS